MRGCPDTDVEYIKQEQADLQGPVHDAYLWEL